MRKLLFLVILAIVVNFAYAQVIVMNPITGDTIINPGSNPDSSSVPVCQGQSLSLTVSITGAFDHVLWMSNPYTAITPNINSMAITITPNQTTNYYLYIFDTPSTVSQIIKINVRIIQYPSIQQFVVDGVTQNPAHYCIGQNGVQVGLQSSQVGVNYQLEKESDGSPMSFLIQGTGGPIILSSNISAGNYQVIADNNGCITTIR